MREGNVWTLPLTSPHGIPFSPERSKREGAKQQVKARIEEESARAQAAVIKAESRLESLSSELEEESQLRHRAWLARQRTL